MNTILFLIYVVVLFTLAYYFRTSGKSESGYLVSNRNLTTYEVGFSAVASTFTATGVLFAFGTVIAFGTGSYGIFIAMFLTIALMSIWAPKIWHWAKKEQILTLSELFKHRFGPLSEKMFAIISIILQFSFLVGSFSISITLLDRMLGLGQLNAAIVSFGIVIAYIAIGGFKAIVKTDQFQYLVMLLFVFVITLSINNPVPVAKVIDIPGWFSGTFLVLAPVFFWANIANPNTWQPVIAARSAISARRGLLLATVLGFLFYGPIIWLAATFAVEFPYSNPNEVLFEGIGKLFDSALAPLLLIALYAAMMSTLDTALFYCATNTVRNILPSKITERFGLISPTRFLTVLFAIVAVSGSFLIDGFIEFVLATFPIMGVAAFPLVVGLFWRASDIAVGFSMIIGTLAFFYLFFFPPENYLWNMSPALLTGFILIATQSFIKLTLNSREVNNYS